MDIRLSLFVMPLQQVINSRQKGSVFCVSVLLEALGLWSIQDDLQKMRLAKAFRAMVENRVLDNIQLQGRNKTRYATYVIV